MGRQSPSRSPAGPFAYGSGSPRRPQPHERGPENYGEPAAEAVLEDERRMVEEILAKRERGEKLTPREESIVAYSPFGTAARTYYPAAWFRSEEGEEE